MRSRRSRLLVLLVLGGLLLPRPAGASSPAPAARPTIFALVIGVSRPIDRRSDPLLYADDDAILFHKLFMRIGQSILLVEPDAESARRHGPLPEARPPTRANVRAAAEELLGRIAAARARGEAPQLYFIYSGHGEVVRSQGHLALADGRFTARDLGVLLGRSRAEGNHVIVDACKSYFIVRPGGGGGGGDATTLVERFPNTGFILSTSAASSSHEWEVLHAGIFSHEVRSGLVGAADLDGDGLVSYDELRGFVEVANATIGDARFRPRIFVHAPHGDGDRALFRVRPSRFPSLTIPASRAGRYLIEDARGVRLADLHSGARVVIVVPELARLYVHDLGRALVYRVDPRPGERHLSLVAEPARPRRSASHEAFSHIFERPFAQGSYEEALRQLGGRGAPGAAAREPALTLTRSGGADPPRQPWELIIEGALGLALLQRSLSVRELDHSTDYRRRGAGLELAGAVHPFAGHRLAWVAGLGLRFQYLFLESTSAAGQHAALRSFELGLGFRWRARRSRWAPVVSHAIAYQVSSFTSSTAAAGASYTNLKLTLAEVAQPLLARRRLCLAALVALDLLPALEAQASTLAANAFGVGTQMGLTLRWGPLFARAALTYQRVSLSSFAPPTLASSSSPSSAAPPLGATDALLGGSFRVGAAY